MDSLGTGDVSIRTHSEQLIQNTLCLVRGPQGSLLHDANRGLQFPHPSISAPMVQLKDLHLINYFPTTSNTIHCTVDSNLSTGQRTLKWVNVSLLCCLKLFVPALLPLSLSLWVQLYSFTTAPDCPSIIPSTSSTRKAHPGNCLHILQALSKVRQGPIHRSYSPLLNSAVSSRDHKHNLKLQPTQLAASCWNPVGPYKANMFSVYINM